MLSEAYLREISQHKVESNICFCHYVQASECWEHSIGVGGSIGFFVSPVETGVPPVRKHATDSILSHNRSAPPCLFAQGHPKAFTALSHLRFLIPAIQGQANRQKPSQKPCHGITVPHQQVPLVNCLMSWMSFPPMWVPQKPHRKDHPSVTEVGSRSASIIKI